MNRKGIHLIILAILITSIPCFAQLDKFNGTFISKDYQMCIDIGEDGEAIEYPMFERISYYRFDIDNQNNVSIRHKMEFIDINSRKKTTHYFTAKDIIVKEDTIRCNMYNPPEMGKTYAEKVTPTNHVYYESLVEHNETVFTVSNNVLHVRLSKTQREFYTKGKIIETDECSDCKEYVFDCYNERDNW